MKITNLKIAIAESGLKQTHIAQEIGVDYTLFSRYVTGDRECPEDVIKKISILLKVPQWQLR